MTEPGPSGVPQYSTDEFLPKRSRYCVAVFVINENGRLHEQLRRMQNLAVDIDILVADGGSTDGSVEPERLRSAGVNTLLTRIGPGRLGTQMRMAFHFALLRGYDGIVVMDGNNKDDPASIPSFVRALDSGADHVQGSRFIAGGAHENTPLSRLLGVRLVHAPLLSLAARFRFTDTTNGFRAYSMRLLTDRSVDLFRDVFIGYELHYYLAIRAPRLGFATVEVPVTRRYPAKGPTPTKITPVRGNIQVLVTLLKACTGRFNPAKESHA